MINDYMAGVKVIDYFDGFTYLFDDKEIEIVKGSIEYLNIPCSFDIEVSSFYDNGEKRATMYVWQLAITRELVVIGRTWEQFKACIEELVGYFELHPEKRKMVIYVHNLAYEFQFICNHFEWITVFAPKNRRPLYALTTRGVEFRCSYFLANASLAHVGENLVRYPVQKLTGFLDYSLLRTSETPLTKDELSYCINDVLVVVNYIQEKIENDGNICAIPLTNTGYVRRYCRMNVLNDYNPEKKIMYQSLMKSMRISSPDEYDQLQRAFQGGFTHTSCMHSYTGDKKWIEDVGSADLTSSYPFAMVCQYYPMSSARFIGDVDDKDIFDDYLRHYCCLFDIEFTNLKPRLEFEHIISISKCHTEGVKVLNNGRVVCAEKLITTCTELDFINIQKFYKWDAFRVANLRVYDRGLLPRDLIMSILDLYEMKTTLKGVEGREIDYMIYKNMINAVYGMAVTNIIRDEVDFTKEGWTVDSADVDTDLHKYNNSRKRFLFYAWGIWVTAHARDNLYSAILEFGEDYVYADTDSIKGINFQNHKKYFDNYNTNVLKQILRVSTVYDIPYSKFAPKTRKGESKLIGVWEQEGTYRFFKACGAKRYLYMEHNGLVNMTVSGLNKKYAMPHLIAKWNNILEDSWEYELLKKAYNGDRDAIKWVLEQDFIYDDIFMEFGDGLVIPAGHTGKLTHTYIDHPTSGLVVDYLGNECQYNELSSIHMEEQAYCMGISGEYQNFIRGMVREEY